MTRCGGGTLNGSWRSPGLSAAEPRCKYGHHRAGAEELLALPDAIAWLGEFRGRATWANVIG